MTDRPSSNRRGSVLTMPDGTRIQVEDWLTGTAGPRRGALMIVHGLGEHFGRYGHVARSLNAIGFDVRGYDQRGFGRSDGARGLIPCRDALLDDAGRVFDDWAAERGVQPFLLGHSMGGAVAARAATGGWIAPCGLILSSPAIAGRMSSTQRLALGVGKRLLPDRAVASGLDASAVSRDPAVVADYLADPLNHGLISPRLADFIVTAGPQSIAAAPSFDAPVLLLLGTADRLIDIGRARDFGAALPAGRLTLKVYEGLFHELFNELPAERARVLTDVNDWLIGQAGAPAG